MVSALRIDTLRDPTAALQELYAESQGADNFPRHVSNHFSRVFRTTDAFQEIPTLDVRNLPDAFPDRALVRFRCMVQDTSPSSEMYLSKSKNGRCGGWGIEFSVGDEERVDYSDLRECTVLWAVSVPAESAWCAEELDGPESQQERPPRPAAGNPYTPQHLHKYPHPTVPHVGVQVKLYDTNEPDSYKSTDVVTFIGILTTEALSTGLDTPIDVPTLHVLFARTHPQTLLCRPYPYITAPEYDAGSSTSGSARAGTSTEPARLREELISWIAEEALGGDREAAEWALLACIARVQSRSPALLSPSLTLSHFPPPPLNLLPSSAPPLPTLSLVLSQLLPLVHTLPLSLDLLNRDPFAPESKEEDLHAGVLQLPQGTVLLVTEGGVSEGKLVERGILNVRALQEVMSAQTLAYAFPFSQFSFPTDISCIVLSEGSKSAFFKTDFCIPLKAPTSPFTAAAMYKPAECIAMPPPEKLAAFRDLVVGGRCGKVRVSEETSEYIQQDFVRERQQDKSIMSDDLIRRMTVAKLYALSLHEIDLTVDIWEHAKAFDKRRLGLQ
ncbi:hypothetical protein AcW2_004299 [Taiwanofungus camphoratus]|nr:hypothetical protein AcW2_004299 [Antrodia cinnamomea]